MATPCFDDLLLRMLAAVPLFRGFGRQELIDLLALGRKVEFAVRQNVFEEGQQGESMYVVLSGSFVVLKQKPGGQMHELARVAAGEHFGEMAIIDRLERTATVQADEDAVTLKFHQRDLIQHPPVAMKLYRNMASLLSRRLRKTNEMLILNGGKARSASVKPVTAGTETGQRPILRR